MLEPSELEALTSSRVTPFPRQTVVESNPDLRKVGTIGHHLSEPSMLLATLAGAALSTRGAADALSAFGRAANGLSSYQRDWLRDPMWYRIGPPRVRPITAKQRRKRLAKIARRSRQANRRKDK